MTFYKFIKIRGCENDVLGYFTPRMFKLNWSWSALKVFGLSYVKERLTGWTIWWVDNEEDFIQAVHTLNELKKTRTFDYKVSL